MKKINLLIISHELKYSCGVSNYIMNNVSQFLKNVEICKIIVAIPSNTMNKAINSSKFRIKIIKSISHTNRSIINFIIAVIKIRILLKKENINVIHTNNHYVTNISRIAVIGLKINIIQTVHGILPEKGILPKYRGHILIAISIHVYEYLKANFSNKKIVLLKGGVNVPEIDFKKKTNKILSVMCVSRLEKEKGVLEVIDFLDELNAEMKSKFKLKIIGEGFHEKDFLVRLNTTNISIEYLRTVKNIDKHYYNNNIFIFNSSSKTEGLPSVLLYAGAYKNIVISSKFIGHKAILNGLNSVLFNNKKEFLALFSDILNNYENYLSKSIKLWIDVKNMHSIKETSKNLIIIYRNSIFPFKDNLIANRFKSKLNC